jgi:uncharacterized protein DUF5615
VIRLLTDENFDNDILRGIRLKNPDADIVRIQDTEVNRADDPTVLAWAAKDGRTVVTHDVHTMVGFAYERVAAGLPMPGVIEVSKKMPIGQAIDEPLMLIGASDSAEWENQVVYLPLQ